MIAWIARATGLHTIIVWIAIAAIGAFGLWGYGALNYRAGLREGKTVEALAWTQKMTELRLKLEQDRKAAQAKIDDIEKQYHEQRQLAVLLSDELEIILRELEAGDDAGKPALSGRLSVVLDKIGR